ncbi:MAG: FAD-binding protein [Desulfovibrio sp.]|uniref:FAD-binding protein n=1 Tax=Desulfovibrio sp. TaxID=885 RepID=UPI0019C5FBE6|nr:FAD-binding protein [Desulfovibrio sp.]MBD5416852.1 FAD-binding protein [Desulfovibrio sp.]MBD5646384.1 FAD-binding protein [Desulfovibrio sp.]
MAEKTVRHQADLLVVGGGIAGLMTAIRGAELGLKVIVADKSNVRYSGAGATGNDHFQCYIPEYHGTDFNAWIEEFQTGQQATIRDINFIRTWMSRSFEMIKLWDSWGIPMKYNGRWEFAGHGMPGDMLNHLHYAGKHQKKILEKEARKRGVEIVNRVMCCDLLVRDGRVCGAVGISTREDVEHVFEAGAVVLTTGSTIRLYPGCTPASLFNARLCPNCAGDGRAMAWRAGADLASLEIPVFRCGPVYLARAGKATWGGVLRDSAGKPVGPFVTRPDNKYGDAVVDVYQDIFMDYRDSARGPVYMDCTGLDREGVEYMTHWLDNEGNGALLNFFKREELDIGTTPLEFRSYDKELSPRGGILYDENARTSLPGLYAAGDEFFGGISCAAVFGWVAAESAARDIRESGVTADGAGAAACESPVLDTLRSIRGRERGARHATWQEANHAIQQIMGDYAGIPRSETTLKAGADNLARISARARETLAAGNPHELARCAEILNLLDVGALVIRAARERKETRAKHIRKDYPFTHPHLNKLLVLRRKDGQDEMEWRAVRKR